MFLLHHYSFSQLASTGSYNVPDMNNAPPFSKTCYTITVFQSIANQLMLLNFDATDLASPDAAAELYTIGKAALCIQFIFHVAINAVTVIIALVNLFSS